MNKSLILIALCSFMTTSCLQAEPLKIVCIGDSITQGRGDNTGSGSSWIPTDGWRWAFWKKMVDAGIAHEFVGTLNTGFESTPVYHDYKGQTFSNRHEARWGWTTEGVRDKLKKTSTQWTADLALIYLGTNREPTDDAEKQSDPDGVARTSAAMRSLVELLRTNNPKMIIAIRLLGGTDARANGLRSAYQKIAGDFNTPEAPAVIVEPPAEWQWDPSRPRPDTIDGCHPTKSGDEKIAAGFFQTVKPCLKN